jgi:hypothetical protein
MWFLLTASEYVSRERDYFRKLLETSRFTPCREGTYFQVASYAAISTDDSLL